MKKRRKEMRKKKERDEKREGKEIPPSIQMKSSCRHIPAAALFILTVFSQN